MVVLAVSGLGPVAILAVQIHRLTTRRPVIHPTITLTMTPAVHIMADSTEAAAGIIDSVMNRLPKYREPCLVFVVLETMWKNVN